MDHTKIYLKDLDSPRQELSNGGLEFVVAPSGLLANLAQRKSIQIWCKSRLIHVYSWIDRALQSWPTLAFSLWLSFISKPRPVLYFLSKNSGVVFFSISSKSRKMSS